MGLPTEIAAVPQDEILKVGAAPDTFAALLSSADLDVVEGRDIAVKDALIGVAFIATKATFYPGIGGDFVTLEILTRDGVEMVVNDGGTGIRRQVVAYLKAKGLVDVGPAHPKYENPDDKPVELWPVVAHQEQAVKGFEIKLLAKRGLRKSEYAADKESGRTEGTTYYLA